MLKIFTNAFHFKGIFRQKEARMSLIILYFVLLVMVISFPMNFQIIQNDGFSGLTQFTRELRLHLPEWFPEELPNGGTISRAGLDLIPDKEYIFQNNGFTLIINPKEEVDALKNTIVLDDDEIFYFNQKGDYITGDYKHVEKALYFYELKNMDRGEAASEFFDLIDSAFNKYAVFYSVISYTLIQYAMNSFLVIVLALIMLLIKIKFEKVTTFSENIKIVIVSMTIPSIIAFIASLLNFRALNPFFAVIFQFLTPIIAILSLYKGRITKEKSPKGL